MRCLLTLPEQFLVCRHIDLLKHVQHLFELVLRAVTIARQLLEELDLALNLLGLDLLEHFDEVVARQHGKLARSLRLDGGCAGLVSEQGQLSERLALMQLARLGEPLDALESLQRVQTGSFSVRQVDLLEVIECV